MLLAGIVEMHRGVIKVHSDGEGAGSTFYFEVPLYKRSRKGGRSGAKSKTKGAHSPPPNNNGSGGEGAASSDGGAKPQRRKGHSKSKHNSGTNSGTQSATGGSSPAAAPGGATDAAAPSPGSGN